MSTQDRSIPPESNPGRVKQVKLHDMALAYAQALHLRVRRIAAETAGMMRHRELLPPPGCFSWQSCLEDHFSAVLAAMLAEQEEESPSPFAVVVADAFSAKADRQTSPRGRTSLPPAAERIAGAGMARLITLVDLRTVEGICEEVLTDIFRWDGRRFVIGPEMVIASQGTIDRLLFALRTRTAPPDGEEAVRRAIKLALTLCIFWGEPESDRGMPRTPPPHPLGGPDTTRAEMRAIARLKELYINSSSRSAGDGVDEDRTEKTAEIESFCRTLTMLREAMEEAGG